MILINVPRGLVDRFTVIRDSFTKFVDILILDQRCEAHTPNEHRASWCSVLGWLLEDAATFCEDGIYLVIVVVIDIQTHILVVEIRITLLNSHTVLSFYLSAGLLDAVTRPIDTFGSDAPERVERIPWRDIDMSVLFFVLDQEHATGIPATDDGVPGELLPYRWL